jgi:hypothetical protein
LRLAQPRHLTMIYFGIRHHDVKEAGEAPVFSAGAQVLTHRQVRTSNALALRSSRGRLRDATASAQP